MSTLLNADIAKALISWVETESGVTPAIWEEALSQSPEVGIKPPYPFMALKVVSGPSRTTEFDRERTDDDIYTQTSEFQFTLSVKIIAGNERLDPITLLDRSLDKDTVSQFFRENGFSLRDKGEVVDTTSSLSTMYERSAMLEVFFGYREGIEDNNGTIEKVGVTPTINGEEEDEFTINTNP